jgi:hypothetical protein
VREVVDEIRAVAADVAAARDRPERIERIGGVDRDRRRLERVGRGAGVDGAAAEGERED